ncbi:MAG: acylphosphatase [Lachnospiraceae bacterium]|nr:acylphosphatase [Lachnospiraceae bacterium]
MMIRKHFVVSGRVQGVGFRYTAARVAEKYGLTGWVRNREDETVELEIQGPKELVDTYIKRVQLSSVWMRIEHVEETDIAVIDEKSFRVRY